MNLLPWKQIAGSEEQEQRHQHEGVKGATSQAVSKNGGFERIGVTARVVIHRPIVIEVKK
jgi:hypothetical protein